MRDIDNLAAQMAKELADQVVEALKSLPKPQEKIKAVLPSTKDYTVTLEKFIPTRPLTFLPLVMSPTEHKHMTLIVSAWNSWEARVKATVQAGPGWLVQNVFENR